MTLIVDSHTHIFPPETRERRESFRLRDRYFAELYADPKARTITAEELIAEMDASGVDVSVVCGFGWDSIDLCAMHNDYLMDAVRRYPQRLVGLMSLQPLAGERALIEIDRCLGGGLRGIGELMPDGQGFRLHEVERIGHVFGYAAERGFPVMTHSSEPMGHLYPGKGTAIPADAWQLVRYFPRTKIILAHWGGGYPFYELMPEVREASRNVYYDSAASSYLYDTSIFRHLAEVVGSEKLLWGSDYPVLRQGRFIRKVKDLGLEKRVEEGILGGNALRLFGIRSMEQ